MPSAASEDRRGGGADDRGRRSHAEIETAVEESLKKISKLLEPFGVQLSDVQQIYFSQLASRQAPQTAPDGSYQDPNITFIRPEFQSLRDVLVCFFDQLSVTAPHSADERTPESFLALLFPQHQGAIPELVERQRKWADEWQADIIGLNSQQSLHAAAREVLIVLALAESILPKIDLDRDRIRA